MTGGMSSLLGILLALTVLNLQTLSQATRFFEQDDGIWNPTQLERDILRLRAVANDGGTNNPTLATEYQLRHNLVSNRLAAMNSFYSSAAESQYTSIEYQAFTVIQREFQRVPAQEINDLSSFSTIFINLEFQSRTMVNERRILVQQTANQQRTAFARVRTILFLIGGGMVIQAIFVIASLRRRFDTTLELAYQHLQARSTELETAQQELRTAHAASEARNTQLRDTLTALASSSAERQALTTQLSQMTFPVIPIIPQRAVLPLIGHLDSARMDQLASLLPRQIEQQQLRHVLIDLTGVTGIDPDTLTTLADLLQVSLILGCRPVFVGIPPHVAMDLQSIRSLPNAIQSFSTLQDAIDHIRSPAVTVPRPTLLVQ